MSQGGSEAAIPKNRTPIRMILIERYEDVFYRHCFIPFAPRALSEISEFGQS